MTDETEDFENDDSGALIQYLVERLTRLETARALLCQQTEYVQNELKAVDVDIEIKRNRLIKSIQRLGADKAEGAE